MWIKKYVKIRIILFKNWKLLLKITYQTAPWSLSLFLRLGIQLCFPTSMPVLLFTTSQICYHQCEAKMKRSQISVRKRISELLCVKSTSFFFLSSVWYLISIRNLVYIPVWPKQVRYGRYLNRYETPLFLYWCTHRYEIYQPYRPVLYKIFFLDYNASIKRNFS